VTVVDLARNFGHHKAIMTGLQFATGAHMFLLDSDLEEEPEWLTPFWQHLDAEAADVVYGIQAVRKGNAVERLSGPLYYRAFRYLTGIDQPDNIVTARLMTRRYVDSLLRHTEREINIGGLWLITGYRQVTHIVKKHSSSPTTYTLRHKLNNLVNGVTSFSNLPLMMIFQAGVVISLTAVVYILYNIIVRLVSPTVPGGYTALIASIWFFSGLIVLFQGVQGIYLSKIFTEVKQRPYTIVRQVISFPTPDSTSATEERV
jgi:putative glycosyltransferase